MFQFSDLVSTHFHKKSATLCKTAFLAMQTDCPLKKCSTNVMNDIKHVYSTSDIDGSSRTTSIQVPLRSAMAASTQFWTSFIRPVRSQLGSTIDWPITGVTFKTSFSRFSLSAFWKMEWLNGLISSLTCHPWRISNSRQARSTASTCLWHAKYSIR